MQKRSVKIIVIIFMLYFLLTQGHFSIKIVGKAVPMNEEIALIVEVNGDPHVRKKQIEARYPTLTVVAVYDTLFNGLALKGKTRHITKLAKQDFIQALYPVQTYSSLALLNEEETFSFEAMQNLFALPQVFEPNQFNDTPYTGKGIKIAVIDTGIDIEHKALKENYRGGFDLVDLDDVPAETTSEQGMPTNHGTHVAGIIAANGQIKGVAPDAEIYAYRALGPGGFGTTIQVIAAMEAAVKDKVHVMNLSLGNTINGPDYPTSKAVNEAFKRGVAVVVANGNSGPNNWTVGAPATAKAALSIGAYKPETTAYYVYNRIRDEKITMHPLRFSEQWPNERKFKLATADETEMTGKIVILEQNKASLTNVIKHIERQGAAGIIIKQIDPQALMQLQQLETERMTIPLAVVSEQNGNKLIDMIDQYVEPKSEIVKETVAQFSSRGPVTVDWQLKPNVIAPGVNVLSTVPLGYSILSGTSMAAPHVAGAIALIKEAKPHWTNEQIYRVLETTARKLTNDKGSLYSPIDQGAGLVQIKEAIKATTCLENSLLSFGKIDKHIAEREMSITIHNLATEPEHFYFAIPKTQRGLTWQFPQAFTVNGKTNVTIPIKLKMNRMLLPQGVNTGWLVLKNNQNNIYLPYMFMNETDNFSKVSGFSFHLDRLQQDKYKYSLYVSEPIKSLHVHLYDWDTLIFRGTLMEMQQLQPGFHEGEINRRKINMTGHYYGLIVVQRMDGNFENYETEIFIR